MADGKQYLILHSVGDDHLYYSDITITNGLPLSIFNFTDSGLVHPLRESRAQAIGQFDADAQEEVLYVNDSGFLEYVDLVNSNLTTLADMTIETNLNPGLAVGRFTARRHIASRSPAPGETGVNSQPLIQIVIVDEETAVDTNTIQLSLNGANVTPAITQGLTTVSYQVPAPLPLGSTNRIRLIYADNTGFSTTQSWQFVVFKPAFIESVSPPASRAGISTTPLVSVVIADATTQLNSNSVQLSLNSSAVTPTISKSNTITTVSYQVSRPLALGSTNTAQIVFSDNGLPVNVTTQTWQFVTIRGVLNLAELRQIVVVNRVASANTLSFYNADGSPVVGITNPQGPIAGLQAYAATTDLNNDGNDEVVVFVSLGVTNYGFAVWDPLTNGGAGGFRQIGTNINNPSGLETPGGLPGLLQKGQVIKIDGTNLVAVVGNGCCGVFFAHLNGSPIDDRGNQTTDSTQAYGNAKSDIDNNGIDELWFARAGGIRYSEDDPSDPLGSTQVAFSSYLAVSSRRAFLIGKPLGDGKSYLIVQVPNATNSLGLADITSTNLPVAIADFINTGIVAPNNRESRGWDVGRLSPSPEEEVVYVNSSGFLEHVNLVNGDVITLPVGLGDPTSSLVRSAPIALGRFAPIPLLVSISRSGNDLNFTWTGGIAPFTLQCRTNLNTGTPWQDVAGPTTNNSVTLTNAITGSQAYYRIRQ